MSRYLCARHHRWVLASEHGVFHCHDGQPCSSDRIVTPGGLVRTAATVVAEAHAARQAEAVVAP